MFCNGTEIFIGAGHDFLSHVDIEGGAVTLYLLFLLENIGLLKLKSFTEYKMSALGRSLFFFRTKEKKPSLFPFHSPKTQTSGAFVSNPALAIAPLLLQVFMQNGTPGDSRMGAWPCL